MISRLAFPASLITVCALTGCSASSGKAENVARLAVLRASPAATFVSRNSVVVADRTWPLCAASSQPVGMLQRDVRVAGSVDRALDETTAAFVRAGWRTTHRKGGAGAPVRRVDLARQFQGWTGGAVLLALAPPGSTAPDAKPRPYQLEITLSAPSTKSC
jgi:hypothetical protein